MSKFPELVKIVLKNEGYYVNDSRDTGGATNMGITLETLSNYRGKKVTATDVKNMKQDEALAIYKKNYWDPIRADELADGVDLVAFDGAVNHGVNFAIDMLKGSCGDTSSGAKITDTTIKLLNARKPEDVVFSLLEQRKKRYQTRPNYDVYKVGWKNRLNLVADLSYEKFYNKKWDYDLSAVTHFIPDVQDDFSNKDLQRALQGLSYYDGMIDGIIGNKSILAFRSILTELKVNFSRWDKDRVKNAAKQAILVKNGKKLEIDGLVGPMTKAAFEDYFTESSKNPDVTDWKKTVDEIRPPVIVVSKNQWPSSYSEMPKFYGEVGKNQTRAKLPFDMYLAWDKNVTVRSMTVHEKIASSVERLWQKVYDEYGLDEIKRLRLDSFGGSLNVRKMRGGSSWSIHSWGAAIDIDPERNQLKWDHTRAQLAKDDYDAYWKIVASEGVTGLGPAADYDWMHIQWCGK